MAWRNLLSVFKKDDLFTQALHESHSMLDIALEMFQASINSLRHRDDGTVPIDIYAMDKEINRFERDVRRKVITHLAVSGSSDLASGLVLANVVIDIERIGDYAKNIYDLAKSHPHRLSGYSIETEVRDLETRTSDLFSQMVQSFKHNDVEKAREIMVNYREKLSSDCDRLVTRIVSGNIEGIETIPPGDAAALALYIRYLKRIAGHCRNLVSSIVNPFHRIGYREKKDEA